MGEREFAFGVHVGGRDAKAFRKTVSGLTKLIHPDGKPTKDEVAEYIELGMELRRRVKEQLKKLGGLEYWDMGFSYTDRDTGAERVVGLPESGGSSLISGESLPAGSAYTIGTDTSDQAARKLALFLIQTQVNPGSGRVIPLGTTSASRPSTSIRPRRGRKPRSGSSSPSFPRSLSDRSTGRL